MTNVLILNGHQPYPTSQGRLNASFCTRATAYCQKKSHPTRLIHTAKSWDLETEIENQLWADIVIVQFPLNSMGLPWSLKRYLDEVYTAGMDGRLARRDGRTRSDSRKQYGSGGSMHDTSYMLSVTLNAPKAAFGDPKQNLFKGRTLDDLLAPVHINFAFFGMQPLSTFASYDVSKAPTIESDLLAFDRHLECAFP